MARRLLRLLLVASLLGAPAAARAQARAPGEIDWQRRVIKAHGQGTPDLNAPSISVARLGAERAAKVSALHNLLETLKAARTVPGGNLAAALRADRASRTKTEAVLRAFKVVSPQYFSDGGVALEVEVELDKLPPEIGRLVQPPPGIPAPGAAPAPRPVPASPTEPGPGPESVSAAAAAAAAGSGTAGSGAAPTTAGQAAPPAVSAGFIVDAGDSRTPLGHSPRIVDEAGGQVYGPEAFDADKLASRGTAAYAGFAPSVDAARKDARLAVGSPLVVRALRVAAAGSEVVISVADGDRLRGSRAALQEGRVVFVSAAKAP